jgi:hypothetical protein
VFFLNDLVAGEHDEMLSIDKPVEELDQRTSIV